VFAFSRDCSEITLAIFWRRRNRKGEERRPHRAGEQATKPQVRSDPGGVSMIALDNVFPQTTPLPPLTRHWFTIKVAEGRKNRSHPKRMPLVGENGSKQEFEHCCGNIHKLATFRMLRLNKPVKNPYSGRSWAGRQLLLRTALAYPMQNGGPAGALDWRRK